jgi:hypothetical protein
MSSISRNPSKLPFHKVFSPHKFSAEVHEKRQTTTNESSHGRWLIHKHPPEN